MDQLPDPHLGLDFFTIKLSDQEHILAMEQQLTAKNQEFFIDQKKRLSLCLIQLAWNGGLS